MNGKALDDEARRCKQCKGTERRREVGSLPRAIIDELDQVRCGLIGIFPSFLMNPQLASALQQDDLLP